VQVIVKEITNTQLTLSLPVISPELCFLSLLNE
jgi:hypothetical protein